MSLFIFKKLNKMFDLKFFHEDLITKAIKGSITNYRKTILGMNNIYQIKHEMVYLCSTWIWWSSTTFLFICVRIVNTFRKIWSVSFFFIYRLFFVYTMKDYQPYLTLISKLLTKKTNKKKHSGLKLYREFFVCVFL